MGDTLMLNLGSGPVAVAGWVNIDRSPNVVLDRIRGLKGILLALKVITPAHMTPWSRDVLRADIRNLPYGADSVQAVYSSHTLEHLYFRDAERVLRECARVLRPGGILRLALPNAEQMALQFTAGCSAGRADAAMEYNARLLAHPLERPGHLQRLRLVAGGHVHRWQPSPVLLESMLAAAGFRDIQRESFRTGRCPGLAAVESREESFFIEAIK